MAKIWAIMGWTRAVSATIMGERYLSAIKYVTIEPYAPITPKPTVDTNRLLLCPLNLPRVQKPKQPRVRVETVSHWEADESGGGEGEEEGADIAEYYINSRLVEL